MGRLSFSASRIFGLAGLVLSCCAANAAKVTEVSLRSELMDKSVPLVVVLPDDYETSTNRYPVVYLFHGAGGNCHTYERQGWPQGGVDAHGFIVVAPDGAATSWWIDSPVDPAFKYESHVIREIVPYVDAHYRTIPDRAHRAACGASMGGHGAATMAINHRDLFSVLGMLAPGVDLRPFADRWEIKKRLGTIQEHPDYWKDYSVLTRAADLRNGELAIITVIGTSDFFLLPNRSLHTLLSDNGVAHTYIEIRGATQNESSHHFDFSAKAYPIVFRFVAEQFERKGKTK